MRFNWKRMTMTLAGVALLSAGPMFAKPVFAATQPAISGASTEQAYIEPSVRASMLLAEIQEEAGLLRYRAENLRTFERSTQFSWQSHAFYLERVKGHINAVGERLAELQAIRHDALPWQQKAIDHVTVHAVQIASSTQAALVHLNEEQNRLFAPDYRQNLRTIASRSDDMKQSVDNFINYEKAQKNNEDAQQKFLHLHNELGLR